MIAEWTEAVSEGGNRGKEGKKEKQKKNLRFQRP